MAAEQQRINHFPSSQMRTGGSSAAMCAPEATPRQHSARLAPCGERFGDACPAGTDTLCAGTPRQQVTGAAPCEAGVGTTASAGDHPRPLFPSSWHCGQDAGLRRGMSTALGPAQQPGQPVLFCPPPRALPARPRRDSRTLFPVTGPSSDPDPANVEEPETHVGRALLVGGASEARDAGAASRSASQLLVHGAERHSWQDSADLELCAALNPAPSPRQTHSAPLRPASAPSPGSPRAARSDDERGRGSCSLQGPAPVASTQRACGVGLHAQAGTAAPKDPGAGAGRDEGGDSFASGELAEPGTQCAPDAEPAPDPGPAQPDARCAAAPDVSSAARCTPAAHPSQGFNPSQEGALDALVGQLVAQPALLRLLLARLLLSPGACAQLGHVGPAPADEHFQESARARVLPGPAVPARDTEEPLLPALVEPGHGGTGSPQRGGPCSASEGMPVTDQARMVAPESGAAGTAEQSSACGTGGRLLHGAPAAGPGSPPRARSSARASSRAPPAAARGTRAGRAVHMTQISKHPIIGPQPDRPSSPQHGSRDGGARPHSASTVRSMAPERLRAAQEFSFAPALSQTGSEVAGVAGSSPERGPALDEAGPAEVPARGVASPVDSWLAESSAKAAPEPTHSSPAGLPGELGSYNSEHGDQQASADMACHQAACGAAHVCQALPAGDAALVVSPQQQRSQGPGARPGSLYAQPRAWDDQWEAGNDGAVPCGVPAPSLASGPGSERGVAEGLEAEQLSVDREHASLPAMHAALVRSDSAGSPAADAAGRSPAAGTAEHITQLSEAASKAGAGVHTMDTADQQHEPEPDASAATCSYDLADVCISMRTVSSAIFKGDAAGK